MNLTTPSSYTPKSRFFAEVKRYKLTYAIGLAFLCMTSICEIAAPKFIGWAIDSFHSETLVPQLFRGSNPIQTISLLSIGLLSALFVGFTGRIGWRQMLARRTHFAGFRFKVEIWDSLRKLSPKQLGPYSVGDLMSRMIGDVNAARSIFGFSFAGMYDLVFFTIFATLAMLSIDWQLTLLSWLILPILPPILLKLAREERERHSRAQEELAKLSDMVAQAIMTKRVIRASGQDLSWEKQLMAQADIYAKAKTKVIMTACKLFPLGALPFLTSYIVLLVFGIWKISHNTLTIGGFVAIQSYVLLLQGPLFDLGVIVAEWQKGFASLSRVLEILNLKPSKVYQAETEQNKKDLKVAGRPLISIQNLTFSYGEDQNQRRIKVKDTSALSNISLNILPHEKIGITGPIGSGKSTLIHILAGICEIESQRVFIDDCDLSSLNRNILRAMMTVVPQKPFLFAGSFRYNLALNENYTDEELWRILEVVDLAKEVSSRASGLDASVGEFGSHLSGGQKQRLTLARALLREEPILLLDDCLSAVDSLTEERILNRIANVIQKKTIIWVAHRVSTLKLCDRIYEFEQGRITHVLDNLDKENKVLSVQHLPREVSV